MAKKSVVQRNIKRRALAETFRKRRNQLKQEIRDPKLPAEERFLKCQTLAKLPRNSAPSRVTNRCSLTGRPRGYYRKFRMSRLALRELASQGLIPGMTKASW